jgi:hypothetical protein
MDTRRLQRTLFRMQADPEFGHRVATQGAAAVPELGPAEVSLLLQAEAAGVRADHRGRRQAQILGNLASEYALTLAEAARGALGVAFLLEFPASAAFHEAIIEERGLPEAFGAWAESRARAAGDGIAAASAALETAMVRARRELRPAAAPGPGEVALAPRAWLVQQPAGAFARAQEVRAALDAGREAPPPPPDLVARASEWLASRAEAARNADPKCETVLLVVVDAPRNYRLLREIAPERLEPAAAELLHAALTPLDAAALARLGAARGWSSNDVEEFVADLVADGVLRRG